ncbi:Maf family protein [Phenylobacterium immobile]|uniref:Maf family protein n=1 Tax=Phenylobacterium immobile TaxID=21 RepID=UPI001FDF5507
MARRAVLDGARVPFQVDVAGVDEEAVKAERLAAGEGPREIAEALAELKAVKISQTRPDYVIGADQTLDLDGVLYDKAETLEAARIRLHTLRGRTHLLHSAVCVAKDGMVLWRRTSEARLTMRNFSDAFLDDYLAREGQAALGSVGCYRLEDLGAQLFSSIEGDYFAILGLPLLELMTFLRGEKVLAA